MLCAQVCNCLLYSGRVPFEVPIVVQQQLSPHDTQVSTKPLDCCQKALPHTDVEFHRNTQALKISVR